MLPDSAILSDRGDTPFHDSDAGGSAPLGSRRGAADAIRENVAPYVAPHREPRA